ncbi:MAG TPA: hypothetical protein VNH64_11030, partial [Parvularculaceae bacterium]|nr:hypothetical protein [Parvularculaceae bacterium]
PLGFIAYFALFVVLAIANIRNSEWHKRYMLAATIFILDAPIARPIIYFLAFKGHMPVPAGLPAEPPPMTMFPLHEIVTDLFLLIPILFDWRRRGRPHPAYIIAFVVAIAYEVLSVPFSATPAWHGFANWLYSLGR